MVLLQQVGSVWPVDQLLYKLSAKLRQAQDRKQEPMLLTIDSQSVKTVSGMSEKKGYDDNKKVTGRKRHIAVDVQGNVMAVGITAANVHDKPGAMSLKEEVDDHAKVKKVLVAGAYKGITRFAANRRIEWEVLEKKLRSTR